MRPPAPYIEYGTPNGLIYLGIGIAVLYITTASAYNSLQPYYGQTPGFYGSIRGSHLARTSIDQSICDLSSTLIVKYSNKSESISSFPATRFLHEVSITRRIVENPDATPDVETSGVIASPSHIQKYTTEIMHRPSAADVCLDLRKSHPTLQWIFKTRA